MSSVKWLVACMLAIALPTIASIPAAPPTPAPLTPQWEALEATGSVVTLSNLDAGAVKLLLGISQRLVADPLSGTAVAEILPAQLPLLGHLRTEHAVLGASEEVFRTQAEATFPALMGGSQSTARYLQKIPSSRVIAPSEGLPRVQRRESSPETSCLYEGFEEVPIWWEDGGPWYHFESGRDNGEGDFFWLDEDCTAAEGSWSACAVFGGDYGQYLDCFDDYDYTTDSWMKYAYWIGCAAGYGSANLRFAMTLQSEQGYDTFGYYASVDDINYYGYFYSGDFSTMWYEVVQDLRSFYGLGDLTRYPEFALAFNFYADDEVQSGWGAFVDDIDITYDQIDIADVYVARNPFRLKVYGANFVPGAWVYIDGEPVPAMKFKHPGLVVAKGGKALKAMVNVGQEVCVQVMNPNGNTTECLYFRY